MWDRRTARGEGPWYRNPECQPHLPLLLGAQREWGCTRLSAMTGQMPPSHPGALWAEGPGPSVPDPGLLVSSRVLSTHLGQSCWGPRPSCVPLGHVCHPQGCLATVASVPVSPPVPSSCSHACNCLSFCSF